MGSGKTTVVSPLLCLLLGDKKHLTVEVENRRKRREREKNKQRKDRPPTHPPTHLPAHPLTHQIVPPALLEFSRSILRSSFSSILQKRVYTFNFDRSSMMTSATLKKLRHAKENAGVVVCFFILFVFFNGISFPLPPPPSPKVSTPSAVKSLMLRYIENLFMIQKRETHSKLARKIR